MKKCKQLKTKTIAFRVTEAEYIAYVNNKEMKELIQKYSRACLSCISINNVK